MGHLVMPHTGWLLPLAISFLVLCTPVEVRLQVWTRAAHHQRYTPADIAAGLWRIHWTSTLVLRGGGDGECILQGDARSRALAGEEQAPASRAGLAYKMMLNYNNAFPESGNATVSVN